MNVTLRSHYSLNFLHRELVDIGFNEDVLCQLYCHTSRRTRKFRVFWDSDNCIHFGESEDCRSREEEMYRSFYASLLTWCYHKTRIQCYRVIHHFNAIHLLFNHLQNDVNPRVTLPNHDFTGFDPVFLTHKDGSSNLEWKIHQNFKDKSQVTSEYHATVRPSS